MAWVITTTQKGETMTKDQTAKAISIVADILPEFPGWRLHQRPHEPFGNTIQVVHHGSEMNGALSVPALLKGKHKHCRSLMANLDTDRREMFPDGVHRDAHKRIATVNYHTGNSAIEGVARVSVPREPWA